MSAIPEFSQARIVKAPRKANSVDKPGAAATIIPLFPLVLVLLAEVLLLALSVMPAGVCPSINELPHSVCTAVSAMRPGAAFWNLMYAAFEQLEHVTFWGTPSPDEKILVKVETRLLAVMLPLEF